MRTFSQGGNVVALMIALVLVLVLALPLGSEAFLVRGEGASQNTSTSNRQQQQRQQPKSTRLAAVGKTLRRVRDSVTNQERSRDDLKLGIAGFYDRSSKLWEDVWGERMYNQLLPARAAVLCCSGAIRNHNSL